jgi:hypothetical protein
MVAPVIGIARLTLRRSLVAVGLVVSLAGCAVATPPGAATSASSASAATSATPTYDTLPSGYRYGYLRMLKQVSGRWLVVMDPVTMCSESGPGSANPDCKGVTYSDDYEILNLSTKTYTVPLATGAKVTVIVDPGGPEDYGDLPLTEKSWDDGVLTVNYATNAAGEVTSIKEFWHP